MVSRCVGKTHKNALSAIERAKKGLDTAILVSNKQQAKKIKKILDESNLTETERLLISVHIL